MANSTLKLPSQLFRSVEVSREAVNEEKRSVELSFSSEDPCERWFGREILDHKPESVNLSRLNGGGALLSEHDRNRQIGVVERAWIDADRKARAIVRFSKSAEGEKEFQDVKDGIRRLVSVGYRVHRMVMEEESDDSATYRCTNWEPLEISLVSVPADATVGVGRSAQESDTDVPVDTPTQASSSEPILHKSMPETVTAPANDAPKIDVVKERADARKAEQDRVRELTAIGRKFNCSELADQAIANDTSLDAFRAQVLEKVGNAKPVTTSPAIGMEKKDLANYSLVRAIRAFVDPQNKSARDAAGFELECSASAARNLQRDPQGFFIPFDVMNDGARTLNATTGSAGGLLVGSSNAGQSMIALLRNKQRVVQLGATTLSGLVGNVAIPKATGGATAYWLSETGSVTASDQAFGQLGLTPHRLAAATGYTKQLLAQASQDVEGYVRNDLMTVLAIEKDRAAINGSNAAGEPLGLLNTTGINSTVTFGGAPTWADVDEFETGIADDNADDGTFGFLTTPSVRGKWKTTLKDSVAGAGYLWPENNMPNGYRAEVSKNVPSNKVLFGNWAEMILADWDGVDVVVDPYSLSLQNQIRIVINLMTDVGIRQPLSFNVSTDAGNQ